MGTKFDDFLIEEAILEDEEGQPWPPAESCLAFVRDYGGDPQDKLNGRLVQVLWYDFASEFFECVFVESTEIDVPELLCTRDELRPANDHTSSLLDSMLEACGPKENVVRLRKQLLAANKDVPYAEIQSWSDTLQKMCLAWALVAALPLRTDRPNPTVPPMPAVLEKF